MLTIFGSVSNIKCVSLLKHFNVKWSDAIIRKNAQVSNHFIWSHWFVFLGIFVLCRVRQSVDLPSLYLSTFIAVSSHEIGCRFCFVGNYFWLCSSLGASLSPTSGCVYRRTRPCPKCRCSAGNKKLHNLRVAFCIKIGRMMFQIVTPIADTCTVSEFVKMFLVPKLLLPTLTKIHDCSFVFTSNIFSFSSISDVAYLASTPTRRNKAELVHSAMRDCDNIYLA